MGGGGTALPPGKGERRYLYETHLLSADGVPSGRAAFCLPATPAENITGSKKGV